jgi:lipopolysaccharide transport system ATP-binding protein
MSDLAISVRGLGKRYRIGEGLPYKRLTEVISGLAANAFRGRGKRDGSSGARPHLWALRDVTFDVKQGEVVGVIGRNGAGKSTLFKVLSRITAMTEGQAEIHGRIGALLEVGTGFHPELTGRENVFLNGVILGMRRAEIARKFDEIVAFAEIERMLDTAVKHYSSGMYMRLAFAVAAHLDPEILLVDEVLAVGDAAFQRKCLNRMHDVGQEGRTVIFVSHNMPAVTRLCTRGILLDGGRVVKDGDIYDVTNHYLGSDVGSSADRRWPEPTGAPGDEVARLRSVRVLSDGRVTDTIDIRRPVTIEMTFWNLKPDAKLGAFLSFFNEQGVHLFVAPDFSEREWSARARPCGIFRTSCTVPGNVFAEGRVRVAAEVSTREPTYEIHFLEFDSVAFQIVDRGEPGSVRAGWGRPIPGAMRIETDWTTEYLGQEQALCEAEGGRR